MSLVKALEKFNNKIFLNFPFTYSPSEKESYFILNSQLNRQYNLITEHPVEEKKGKKMSSGLYVLFSHSTASEILRLRTTVCEYLPHTLVLKHPSYVWNAVSPFGKNIKLNLLPFTLIVPSTLSIYIETSSTPALVYIFILAQHKGRTLLNIFDWIIGN